MLKSKFLYLLFIISIFNNSLLFGDIKGGKQSAIFDFKKQSAQQTPLVIENKILDANRISAWFRNDGEFYFDHKRNNSGFEWPKGSGKTAIFSSGFWIGAKVKKTEDTTQKEIRVAVVGHMSSEYRPGRILPDGFPEDYTSSHLRVYKVRPLLDLPTNSVDYLEWPIDQGAPWIDIDTDGNWNPYIDKIGIQWPSGPEYPDMIQFYVYNDADEAFHNHFGWGRTKPLGVEVRQTNWAYRTGFGDVQFLRFQIYNKSLNTLDSTYLTLWSDPDLGNAFDDYVGCDTTNDSRGKPHNLGYTYNGDNDDGPYGYGNAPPAVGFKLMQGPFSHTGISTDTAIAFGRKLPGYRNLRISGFNFSCGSGQGGCTNPDWYDPHHYIHTYNVMQGLTVNGRPWIDPHTGDTTKFPLAGDPVTRSGWLNSDLFPPSDVRFTMPTGPLTLARGDSQEVIYAVIIDKGANNLNSITRLRNLSERVNLAYENSFKNVPFVSIKNLDLYSPPFLINALVKDAIQVTATLTSTTGAILGTATLYDDGTHEDSLANDDIWSNWLYSNADAAAAMLSLNIVYSNYQTLEWRNILTGITTIGRLKIDAKVATDNINADGIPNPGENIRFKFRLKNYTNFNITTINTYLYKVESPYISHVNIPNNLTLSILPNGTSDWVPNDYCDLSIYTETPTPHIAKVILQLNDDKENSWLDTLNFTVQEFIYPPIDTIPIHSSGYSEGNFRIHLVDYSKLKDDFYKITINKPSPDNITFNLINTQTNDSLLKNHELPDLLYGHNIPVTDGFRIKRGNFTTLSGTKKWNYLPLSNKWFTGVNGYRMDVHCDSRGFIAYPRIGRFINIVSSLPADSLKIVELRFSDSNTQKAYRCIEGFLVRPPRRIIHPEFRPFVVDSSGSGYLYQDYEMFPLGNPTFGRTIPFTVWEVNKKTGLERQLDVAIIERNDTLYKTMAGSTGNDSLVYIYKGNVDGKWNPSPLYYNYNYSHSGDEVILILNTTYSDSPKVQYSVRGDWTSRKNPYLYAVWMRRMNANSTYTNGDVLEITPYFPLTENDVFTFNPMRLLAVENSNQIPDSYKLYNNYPNPFNPLTTIKYDIQKSGRVVIEIYNLLGQKIKTLVNEEKVAGSYTTTWNGSTDKGLHAASGIYFYRIRTENFSNTKKMILMR